MSEMQFDFDGLIQLLAGHLYSEKKVFIRELIQNSHDAIQRRAAVDPEFSIGSGRIDIYTDLGTYPATIRFCDNGIGMSKDDLVNYLSSVGSSGTRANREDAPDVIGQFGIGFLSGFVVAKRIVVRTRAWNSTKNEAWRWENEGRKEYILNSDQMERPGSEVTLYLASAEDNGLIRDEHVRKVIRIYADMLKIPIYLNYGETSVNQRIMPWERKDVSDEERAFDCRIYLEKNMPDSVLEVIPLNEHDEVNVSGVLYITRTRVIGRDVPRVLRVFQKRMFLCENTPELLPKWAGFVNGVFDTPDLSPNAARDGFRRDAAFERLRDKLGELIIAHFDKLKNSNQERLSEILAYHDFSIKAACYYYDIFFDKFGHLLEWRVNSKSPAAQSKCQRGRKNFAFFEDAEEYAWVTLSDLVAALPQPEGDGIKRLCCFTTHSSANQFFEMANAAGSSVLDASRHFENELIKTWAKNHPELRVVYVDLEDDPTVFHEIDAAADSKIRKLASQMSMLIRPGGTGRVRVEARRFKPQELPAILKSSPGAGANKAWEILNDPNSSSSLRAMAEEMLQLARNADMRMTINASNPLIRQLAALDNFDDGEVADLMIGIYNDAILYNQELMTPTNAKIFHQQFGRLMMRSVEYLHQREKLRVYEQREKERQTPGPSRNHRVAFYMTPFEDEEPFKTVREAVRSVVENELGCQLLTAADITYDDMIKGNVRRHIDEADFYIADVTGANPNVMQELGAVHYGRSASPTLLIAGLDDGQKSPNLPADLQGHIACRYQRGDSQAGIAQKLTTEFKANQKLRQMLDEPGREIYLSAAALRTFTNGILQASNIYEILSQNLSTASAWINVSRSRLEQLLGAESDLADAVLKRVRNGLEGRG